ncbi:MAG: sodium-dependent transporter [Pseudomonadota bacterium]
MAQENKRDGFATHLGVLAATLGSAVGLGNIWKFPALTGQNGGAGFLLIYLMATLFVALPVMISEMMLGRKARADAIKTFRIVAPKGSPWFLVGALGVTATVFLMGYYSDVAGWVFAYIAKSVAGGVATTDPTVASDIFNALVSSPIQTLGWQWFVLAFVGSILIFGIAAGIERAVKILMPLLFVLLCVVCVRSLMLDGAADAVKFLFMPDFSKVTSETVLLAMGLAFFKLTLGLGVMVTYGSYYRVDQNLPATAMRVVVCDIMISLLAGLAIFPAVFTFGFELSMGPSLLFVTIPAVFASMPGGYIFTVIFFCLSAVAALGAMLSLVEVPVAWFSGSCGMTRKKATITTVVMLACVGLPATLSTSIWSDISIFGRSIFDFYDFVSSNLLLPIGGIFTAFFVAWVWGPERTTELLSNEGTLQNQTFCKAFNFIIKWIAPLLIAIVLLQGLGVF